jgi:hypothetical protein
VTLRLFLSLAQPDAGGRDTYQRRVAPVFGFQIQVYQPAPALFCQDREAGARDFQDLPLPDLTEALLNK